MSSDEVYSDELSEALLAFTGCVGEALSDICSYSLTIGDAYVPFAPDLDADCGDDDDDWCSQLWVRVASVNPTQAAQGFGGSCGTELQYMLEVGWLRCFPMMEDGEAPTATQVMGAALKSMADMRAVHCAATECGVWGALESGVWAPIGPLGFQYGGVWTFTAEL